MKKRYKIAGGILFVVGAAVLVLGMFLGHNAACGPAPAIPPGTETMKAIVYRCYGSADVLKLEDVAKPVPADDEVLVRIHAASVNPLDWHYMRGSPYIMRLDSGIGAPQDSRLGVDFAGTVESVGSAVTQFSPGDEVFGGGGGAFAEFIAIRENRALVKKPENVSFEQAAAVPIAAITALQALRDHGKLQPGQKVLINGASGGVGTFAVQIAKALGAEVTGVCSTRNVELVRSLGADHVVDYKKENYTESGIRYDLIIDNVANHSPLANRRALTPDGILVIVGGGHGDWFGPLLRPIQAMLVSPFVSQQMSMMLSKFRKEDFVYLAELMQSGQLSSVIDRRYPLHEVADAIRYSEEGRARGKIIIDIL